MKQNKNQIDLAQHGTARHGTNRQPSHYLVQATLFLCLLFLSMPIIAVTCVEEPNNPNCTVPIEDTTVYADDIGPDDTVYWNPIDGDWGDWVSGDGDGGGISGGNIGDGEMSQAKKEYCEQLDKLQTILDVLLSSNSITGTAATGYEIAQASADWHQAIINTAYQDIIRYFDTDGTMHIGSYTSGTIYWGYTNWPISSWSGSSVSMNNGGPQHIFASWVQSLDQGDGSSALQDPDPGTECP